MSVSPKTPLLDAMLQRVLVADGAMGTMLQAADLTLADFQDLDGCNEILNVTRPDVVAGVHDAYFDVGVDAVETNTFGANWANLAEYDIVDRIYELAEAGARIAREVADGPTPMARTATSWVRSVPAPNCPRWVTPTSPCCATPTRKRCSA
jgi:5-methyltetrahydrofolate--homocysteine methyltransferase